MQDFKHRVALVTGASTGICWCAGITGPHEVDIDRYAVGDWQEVIATCLSGTFSA